MTQTIQLNRQEESFWMKQLSGYASKQRQHPHNSETVTEKRMKLQQEYGPSVTTQLDDLLRMRRDQQWSLAAYQKAAIDAMLAYLVDDNDLIPDQVPGIGLLDDAKVIASVAHRLHQSLAGFQEYERFRQTYAHGHSYSPQDWQRFKAQEVRSSNRQRRLRRVTTRTHSV
jgi:uncharacterized membrane protein YkvA (DUF1232 family)